MPDPAKDNASSPEKGRKEPPSSDDSFDPSANKNDKPYIFDITALTERSDDDLYGDWKPVIIAPPTPTA